MIQQLNPTIPVVTPRGKGNAVGWHDSFTKMNMTQPRSVMVCVRHDYMVDREFFTDFPNLNGTASGTNRLYQIRRCMLCGQQKGRWKPKEKKL